MSSIKIRNKTSASERQLRRIGQAHKDAYELGVKNALANFDPGTNKLSREATDFLIVHQKAEAEHGDKRMAFLLGQFLLWHGQEG